MKHNASRSMSSGKSSSRGHGAGLDEAAAKTAVVIVNWNSGGLLERCVEAVQRQTVAAGEVIVVDNASSDGSLEAVVTRFPQVRLVRLAENAGFAKANNIAVRLAEDRTWVALLNPDAFPTPTWLEVLLEAAVRESHYTFFGSRLVRDGEAHVLDGTGDVYHVSGLAWRRGYGQAAQTRVGNEEIFAPCAAAALYLREAFLEVGGFDERYFCYFEDVDLGFRLRLAGHRCLYVASAVVHHVGSGTSGERSDFSIYYGHRNLVWTYVKNMPGRLFWLYLPQHLLLNIVTVLWYVRCGKGPLILSAKRDALCGMQHAWRQRRSIQRRRKAGAEELRRCMARGWLYPYVNRHV